MTHIFISHSSKDNDYVRKLHLQLKEKGFETWVDFEDIEVSTDWWDKIEVAISDCGAFIVLVTESSVNSRYVKREILLAEELNKPIFPLSINQFKWSRLDDLQFHFVQENEMPSEKFYEDIAKVTSLDRLTASTKDAIKFLLSLTQNNDREVIENVIMTIQVIGGRAVLMLIESLDVSEVHVRNVAQEALKRLDKTSVEKLIEGLKHERRGVKDRCARILGRIGDPRAVEPLILGLQDEAIWSACVNALSMSKMGHLSFNRVIDLLQNPDPKIVRRACYVLSYIKNVDAIPYLNKIADHPDEKLRATIEKTISDLQS